MLYKLTIVTICLLSFGCKEMLEYKYDLTQYDYEFIYELPNQVSEVPVNKDVTRYVKTSNKGVSLYLNEDAPVWKGTFSEDTEPRDGYCGPTSTKNLLKWIDVDPSYEELADEMDVGREYVTGSDWAKCAGACTGEILFCTNICLKIVDRVKSEIGAWIKDIRKSLNKHTPQGYELAHTVGNPIMIEEILYQLSQGNPVLINGRNVEFFHVTVLVGIEIKGRNIYLISANAQKESLKDFMSTWSLERYGNMTKRKLVAKVSKMKPFEAMWFNKIQVATETVCDEPCEPEGPQYGQD